MVIDSVKILTNDDLKGLEQYKKAYCNDKVYTSEDEFVFIHKTDYMPKNNRVYSSASSGATYKVSNFVDNVKICLELPYTDDTVHFLMNSEAIDGREHRNFGFSGRKYAVIVPGSKDVFKEIEFFSGDDVEFKDYVDLTGCYIICPLHEADIVKEKNPQVNIVAYEGLYKDGYAEALALKLGFTIENISTENWLMWEGMPEKRVDAVMQKYGFDFCVYPIERQDYHTEVGDRIRLHIYVESLVKEARLRKLNIFEFMMDATLRFTMNPFLWHYLGIFKEKLDFDFSDITAPEEREFWQDIVKRYRPDLYCGLMLHEYRSLVSFEEIKRDYYSYVNRYSTPYEMLR